MNISPGSIVAFAAPAMQAATTSLEFLESRPAIKATILIILVGLVIDFINPQMTSNQAMPSAWRLAPPMFAVLWLMSPSTAQGITATMLMMPLYIRLPDLIRRFVTQVTPSAVYICTLGTLAVRAPRFRNRDLFKHSNLCRRCRQAIGASYILRGSRTFVVRTRERHLMYDNLDEMQTLAIGCHLCEALLGQRTEDAAPGTSAAAASWHGNRERVYLKVEFTQAHSFVDHLIIGHKTTPLLLSLETGSGAMFDKLHLSERARKVLSHGGSQMDLGGTSLSTGHFTTIHNMEDWIKVCSEQHKNCRPLNQDANFLPSRLLYVGDLNRPCLRLVETARRPGTSHLANKTEYLALSHCWGGHIACRLLTTNYASYINNIDKRLLPANFQHAISLTRNLDLDYIWIDSLCIIQDSPSDWVHESPMMGKVFASAHCVVAATASANSAGGCFRTRDPRSTDANSRLLMSSSQLRCYVTSSNPSVRSLFHTRVNPAPLTKRAWAFQERLLSRRMVHFCEDAVLFECNTIQASEFNRAGIRYEQEHYTVRYGKVVPWIENKLLQLSGIGGEHELDDGTRARRGIRGALDVLQALGRTTEYTFTERIEFCKRWFDIVSAYSEGALTRPTDKLIALAGVAELVQDQTGAPYLAGLWKTETFALQLLWAVRVPLQKQPLYCAPSWAWPSVSGRIELLPLVDVDTSAIYQKSISFGAEVKEVNVLYEGQPVSVARSLVDDGNLVISGPAITVSVSKDDPSVLFEVAGSFGATMPMNIGRTSLHFRPDYIDPRNGGASQGRQLQARFLAMYVVTVRRSKHVHVDHGLVLQRRAWLSVRAKPAYERVGVWYAISTTATPGIGSATRRIVRRGLTIMRWQEETVRVY